MSLKFREVDVIQVSIKDNYDLYTFYNIDDAVDFIVTYIHEFDNDAVKYMDEFSIMKQKLHVYVSEAQA